MGRCLSPFCVFVSCSWSIILSTEGEHRAAAPPGSYHFAFFTVSWLFFLASCVLFELFSVEKGLWEECSLCLLNSSGQCIQSDCGMRDKRNCN